MHPGKIKTAHVYTKHSTGHIESAWQNYLLKLFFLSMDIPVFTYGGYQIVCNSCLIMWCFQWEHHISNPLLLAFRCLLHRYQATRCHFSYNPTCRWHLPTIFLHACISFLRVSIFLPSSTSHSPYHAQHRILTRVSQRTWGQASGWFLISWGSFRFVCIISYLCMADFYTAPSGVLFLLKLSASTLTQNLLFSTDILHANILKNPPSWNRPTNRTRQSLFHPLKAQDSTLPLHS